MATFQDIVEQVEGLSIAVDLSPQLTRILLRMLAANGLWDSGVRRGPSTQFHVPDGTAGMIQALRTRIPTGTRLKIPVLLSHHGRWVEGVADADLGDLGQLARGLASYLHLSDRDTRALLLAYGANPIEAPGQIGVISPASVTPVISVGGPKVHAPPKAPNAPTPVGSPTGKANRDTGSRDTGSGSNAQARPPKTSDKIPANLTTWPALTSWLDREYPLQSAGELTRDQAFTRLKGLRKFRNEEWILAPVMGHDGRFVLRGRQVEDTTMTSTSVKAQPPISILPNAAVLPGISRVHLFENPKIGLPEGEDFVSISDAMQYLHGHRPQKGTVRVLYRLTWTDNRSQVFELDWGSASPVQDENGRSPMVNAARTTLHRMTLAGGALAFQAMEARARNVTPEKLDVWARQMLGQRLWS